MKLGMPDGSGQYRTEGTSSLSRMWGALAYEIKMYFAMRATHGSLSTSLLLSGFIGNAIGESAILHARILCDLFSSESKRWEDDIGFSDLFDDWETAGERYSNRKGHIAEMEITYGD